MYGRAGLSTALLTLLTPFLNLRSMQNSGQNSSPMDAKKVLVNKSDSKNIICLAEILNIHKIYTCISFEN